MKAKTVTKLGAGALAVVAVASLVGSISGTIAWFQYTTRVTANYTGVVSHMSSNLNVSLDGTNWKADLTKEDIRQYLLNTQERDDTALRPVTTGMQEANKGLNPLYRNPIRQYASMGSWSKATAKHDYIKLPLKIRNTDVNGENGTLLSTPIYLADLTMEQVAVDGKLDISDALRVHLSAGSNQYLFSNHGEAVKAHGELDLDGDHVMDLELGYGDGRAAVDYGISGSVASADDLPDLQINDFFRYAPESVATFNPNTGVWTVPDDADVEYHVWNGSNWEQKNEAPATSGLEAGKDLGLKTDKAALEKAKAEAIVREGDVYKVGDNYYRYEKVVSATKKDHLGWIQATNDKANSLAVAEYLVDDSDPYNINGTAIAYTYGKAASVDKLLTKDVHYVHVTADDTYRLFDGAAWADKGGVKPAAPAVEYAEVETAASLNNLLPSAKDIYAVGDITYKWDATEKVWVPNADFTVDSGLPENPVNGKTYYLKASGLDNLVAGIYRYDNGSYANIGTELTLNVTIYLEGWQALATSDEPISTDEFNSDVRPNAKAVGTVYQLQNNNTFVTWDGVSFREGKWSYDAASGWVAGSDLTPIEVANKEALPNKLVKTNAVFHIKDDNGDAIFRWTGAEWVEGGNPVWSDADYVDSSFNIGLRFAAPTHADH